jgi:hypothetical protein
MGRKVERPAPYSFNFSQKLIGLTKKINSPGFAMIFCLLQRFGDIIPDARISETEYQ